MIRVVEGTDLCWPGVRNLRPQTEHACFSSSSLIEVLEDAVAMLVLEPPAWIGSDVELPSADCVTDACFHSFGLTVVVEDAVAMLAEDWLVCVASDIKLCREEPVTTGASGKPKSFLDVGDWGGVEAAEEPPLKLSSPLGMMGLEFRGVAAWL